MPWRFLPTSIISINYKILTSTRVDKGIDFKSALLINNKKDDG